MRTDLHRPSAVIPANYEFVSCDYYGSGIDAVSFMGDRMYFREHMKRTGGKFSGHEHGGTCGVCGAAAMYVARFHHVPTNEYITTGMDCADKMHIGNAIAFRAFKKRIAAGRKAFAGKGRAQELLAERGLSAAWAVYTASDRSGHRKAEEIVTDIVGKVVQYGSFRSDAQAELVRKLLADIANRPQRDAEFAAKREVEIATSRHVGQIGQRLTFVLSVERIYRGEGNFGPYVILSAKDSAGNVIVYKGGNDMGLKVGDVATVKGTVKAHDDYKGLAQTTISRPAVVPVAPPAAETVVLGAA